MIEAERKKAAYLKAHLAGQTEEAQRDMARLEIIRKERADAARLREQIKVR